jgi:hypothetical protein
MTRSRALAVSAGITTLTALSSYGAAGAVYSSHGDDFSYDHNARSRLGNCDQESDSNHTKGLYDYDTANEASNGEIEDSTGNDGNCGQSGALAQAILRHRTCERNLVSWDCDNWADTQK